MRKERINEIWGVLFLLLGLFTLASLAFYHSNDLPFFTSDPANPIQNVTGIIGAYLAFGLRLAVGVSAFLIPGLFLLWSACFFTQQVPEKKFFKFVGLGIALFSTSTLVAISINASERFEQGGAIGYITASHLLRYFGMLGSYILAGSCLLLSLLLATDFLIYPLVRKFWEHFSEHALTFLDKFQGFHEWIEKRRAAKQKKDQQQQLALLQKQKQQQRSDRQQAAAAKTPQAEAPKASSLPDIPLKVKQYRPDLPEELAGDKSDVKKEKSAKESKELRDAVKELKEANMLPAPPVKPRPEKEPVQEEKKFEGVIGSKAVNDANYQLPPIDLLRKPTASEAPTDNLQGNSKILEETLGEFGIEVKVVEVEQGPVITRYELMPAPGVKVNSIAALSDDLALALKAASVRLIIPIPGKSAIGVEVPNNIASMVSLREMIESQIFRSKKCILPLALGKDTSGKVLISDLTGMPHLLIAGTTGSGKTVCVNSIIAGLMYACTPDELKFVMVDPKMVELSGYNKIPHMLTPVVTDVKKAAHTLNWVINEMENRYKLFANIGVRNIQAFNSRPLSPEAEAEVTAAGPSENVVPARLPYIVVIIDELADLMMVAQDKVEMAIARLAQLSRAVGIHLILATQRPSVDVITGVIKANFPARISFKVASKVDSRTVIDASGADKLIGKGDMLFMKPGDEKPTRGQAAYVTDEEINGVVKFVAAQAKPEFHPEIAQLQEGKTGGGAQEKDELFDEAVAVVLETGQASTSNLQRRLRLGYTRAARIVDQMEAEGLIGPAQGAKPRDIYMDRAPEPSVSATQPVQQE